MNNLQQYSSETCVISKSALHPNIRILDSIYSIRIITIRIHSFESCNIETTKFSVNFVVKRSMSLPVKVKMSAILSLRGFKTLNKNSRNCNEFNSPFHWLLVLIANYCHIKRYVYVIKTIQIFEYLTERIFEYSIKQTNSSLTRLRYLPPVYFQPNMIPPGPPLSARSMGIFNYKCFWIIAYSAVFPLPTSCSLITQSLHQALKMQVLQQIAW